MKRYVHYFSKKYLPRWLILLFDLATAVLSWFCAFLIRHNFDLKMVEPRIEMLSLVVIFPVLIIFFKKYKSYSGILRHSTITDVSRIIIAVVGAGIVLSVISLAANAANMPSFLAMPLSVIIIFVLLLSGILSISRIAAQFLFHNLSDTKNISKKIMIVGAGHLARTTYSALLSDSSENFILVGFIDNNSSLQNKYISGIPIYTEQKTFDQIIPKKEVTEIIFAVENSDISSKQKKRLYDRCLQLGIIVKEVPALNTWIKGELRMKTIPRIKIEDLLGRKTIQLDKNKIELGLKDSIVLITGAAGSIGSEIVRQLIKFKVRKVILFDKAESDLYDLQQEILVNHNYADFEVIVGDVTNKAKLREAFFKFSPSIVFSAAAYKHVPLMEEFPDEAIKVNVGGNKNLVDVSIEFGVEKFVLISTDKAVNPTNVMGATKRLSEMYIQALAQSGKYTTQFITTRFGNVLGSRGSVVPLFEKQIKKGGPVTVTHKNITRYFMTIPEACQLVLEAGFMGNGGEIFVFDMGEPVRIIDLAEKMIWLSGFVPGQDIEIKITGLRPGEKLYEELLDNKEEQLLNTPNEKIMIGKDRKHNLIIISRQIEELLQSVENESRYFLVKKLMQIIPEYVSVNANYMQKEKLNGFMQFDQNINGKFQNIDINNAKHWETNTNGHNFSVE